MSKAVVIGATGLVGRNLTELLLKWNQVEQTYTVTRSKPNFDSDRLTYIALDNGNYTFPNATMAFCCLGTTMAKAGSKEAFLKVDFEMVVEFAKKAKDAGINSFALVSSIGANPKSSNFYLRTKGQVEEELKKIGFERLVIVRPSLLLGKRNEKRLGEDIGRVLYAGLRFLFVGPLRKYRGIQASTVAKAMLTLTAQGSGVVVVESDEIEKFCNNI